MPTSVPAPVAIEVLWQGEGRPYRVRLERSDGSTHESTLDLEVLLTSLDELEPVWLSGNPAEYGQVLFNHLFSGAVGFQYAAALGTAGKQGLRLTLQLDKQAPILHTVPWERLYHPHGAGWLPLAVAPNVVFSRYLSTGSRWGLPAQAGPLRALIVISSPYPPDHDLYVDVDRERTAITQVLEQFRGRIEYEVLDRPVTLEALVTRLDEGDGFDILHYTGHGVWKPDEQAAYLILERPANGGVRPQGVSESDLIERLRLGQRLPRLIFLAACESAQRSTADAFLGLGPQLVVAGCPAVIAMQARIETDAARQFAQRFYQELLEEGVVDLAVNRARQRVYERWAWEWAVPVLFMRLPNGVLFRPQERFPPAERKPYKGLAPYTRADHDLFWGRDREITQVYRYIQAHPVTVVYGEAGMGLTSLLEAGVCPRLEQDDNLVVTLSEYGDPSVEAGRRLADELRAQLQAGGHRLRTPAAASLPDVLRAASAQPFPRLILVLDQFERVFELAAAAQDSIVTALADSLAVVGDFLRLVLVIHQDRLPQLSTWQAKLPGLMQAAVLVRPLDPEDAETAIVEPLRVLNWPVTLVPQTLARDLIVPDLAELSNGAGAIDPGRLQIVCEWLYARALEPEAARAITEALYLREKGADGIMARYMEETLRTQFAGERKLVERLLTTMASPGVGRWVSPARLPANGASPEQVRNILERLAAAEVLVERAVNGQRRYAFANQTVARQARRLGGREVERRYQAEEELERIWAAWLARDGLATREQLRYLARAGAHLTPPAVKVLLLLRSAVARGGPANPWLRWLRGDEGRALIRQLEGPTASEPGRRASRSTEDKAAALLGLHDVTPPGQPTNGRPFGPVAWSAVSHSEPATRQTAALALSALGRHQALDRLEWALRAGLRGWPRRQRRAELRGVLADADPEIAKLNADLPVLDRVGVWWWRARRQMQRAFCRIIGLILGGAVGAGLALGLLRMGIDILVKDPLPVIDFAINFWWGAILGAAMALGIALADPLLLRRSEDGGERPSLWRAPLHPDRLPALLAAGLGALFFGVAHLVVMLFNGWSLRGSQPMLLMGFLAGLGLSVALYALPRPGWPARLVSWPLRLGASALIFGLIHRLAGSYDSPSMAVTWAGKFYEASLSRRGVAHAPSWFDRLALLDTVGVGIILTLGLAVGLLVGARWLVKWCTLVERTGD